jgi:hypothetical protein
MRELKPGTYADLKRGLTLVVAPLYRGLPTPVTRESIGKYNDWVADTGARVYAGARRAA